jgi:hypothetical protein
MNEPELQIRCVKALYLLNYWFFGHPVGMIRGVKASMNKARGVPKERLVLLAVDCYP